MFLARRPSAKAIDRFLHESRELPLSYGPAGILTEPPARLGLVDVVVAIGRGEDDFGRARAALRSWAQFDMGWVQLFPRGAPTDAGTVVAVLIRHVGLWSLHGCRVV